MTAPTLAQIACPPWCSGICKTCTCGDLTCRMWHAQQDVLVVGVDIDTNTGELNAIRAGLMRRDDADGPGDTYLSLDIEEHGLDLSLTAARELAAVLIRLADEGEGR